jgi:hypothetical protein
MVFESTLAIFTYSSIFIHLICSSTRLVTLKSECASRDMVVMYRGVRRGNSLKANHRGQRSVAVAVHYCTRSSRLLPIPFASIN